jgi:hypothetical protein
MIKNGGWLSHERQIVRMVGNHEPIVAFWPRIGTPAAWGNGIGALTLTLLRETPWLAFVHVAVGLAYVDP